jgi:hypothetical protein
MKIGIMTFWWSRDNYGQILQCYALQKYLRDAGHDAYLIRYDPRNDYTYTKTPFLRKVLKAFNPIKLYNFLSYKKREFYKNTYEKQKNSQRNFEGFRIEFIKQSEKTYYSYDELVKNPPVADVYIVGSDQVWNTFGMNKAINVIRAYLLDFGDQSIKRIAYAVSFGKEVLDNDSITIFAKLLPNFDYISVREKSGVDICKKCGSNNVEWVLDPTMLLEADKYHVLYKDEDIKKPKKPYCLLYFLNWESNLTIQTVYNWAKRENLDVIYVSGNGESDKYKKIYPTIPEWIYLIEHAEYVITNSYHCSVFSLLFNKQFCILPLIGEYVGMNSRFDSLFELFQIESRFINSDLSILNKEIAWQSVSIVFQNLRSNCKLLNIL